MALLKNTKNAVIGPQKHAAIRSFKLFHQSFVPAFCLVLRNCLRYWLSGNHFMITQNLRQFMSFFNSGNQMYIIALFTRQTIQAI